MKHKEQLKKQYPVEKQQEVDALAKSNIQDWIKANMSRIEFLIVDNGGVFCP